MPLWIRWLYSEMIFMLTKILSLMHSSSSSIWLGCGSSRLHRIPLVITAISHLQNIHGTKISGNYCSCSEDKNVSWFIDGNSTRIKRQIEKKNESHILCQPIKPNRCKCIFCASAIRLSICAFHSLVKRTTSLHLVSLRNALYMFQNEHLIEYES